ncbi:MAG: hypothetical protein WCH43_11220 [Verrucomicrobiota bacterium]
MAAEPAGQLGRRPVTLGRRQCRLRLECRAKYSPLPRHHPPPESAHPTGDASPYQGA